MNLEEMDTTDTESGDNADNPVKPAPSKISTPTAETKLTVAADFVSVDTDRPKADENANHVPPPTPSVETPGKPGRKRSANPSKDALRARERYERMKAEREMPPSFADMPGGAQSSVPAPAPVSAPMGKPVDYKANAEAFFMMGCFGANALTRSEEWSPRSNAEKDQVVNPLAKYMEIKKWDDLSPGWALAASIMFYSFPRLQMPLTKERIESMAKMFKKDKDEKKTEFQTVQPNTNNQPDII